jgi:XTP/dITP diphosphohydrolase
MNKKSNLARLLMVMARLRAPDGCPWDREQTHASIRLHAVEEVYELLDAIEAGDEEEMIEELGDLLLQVVFHCQLASERQAFDFELVAGRLVEKLIRRHPHVFGNQKAKSVDAVWAQWDRIKRQEKQGTPHERPSALDGIPKHLPALMRAEKLMKKAQKAGLLKAGEPAQPTKERVTQSSLSQSLYALVAAAKARGWSAEALLLRELRRREKGWRGAERRLARAEEKNRRISR